MTKDSPTSEVNSQGYWDQRFSQDWDERGGPEQTAFFAELALMLLPTWLKEDIQARQLSILDFGCAEGEALPRLVSAFPGSTVMGGDVSPIAIERARKRYPGLTFTVLAEHKPSATADVLFCSNTIEHFKEWRDKLNEIAACARQHLVIMAPFREVAPLADEHMAQFDFDSIPATLPGGLKLEHLSVRETSDLVGSRWIGRQFLAVWSKASTTSAHASATVAERFGDLDDFDFRDIPPDVIEHCLRLAVGGYTKLAAERAARTQLAQALVHERETNEFRRIEQDNTLIRTRASLSNELHETRVSLENTLLETRVSLENTLIETRVGLENKNYMLGADLRAAREEIDTVNARRKVELAAAREAALEQARQEHLSNLRKAADQFNGQIAARERALQATIETLRQNYIRITSMRTFQWMMSGLQSYGRLRGQVISLPAAPERTTVTIERFDPATALAATSRMPIGIQGRATTGLPRSGMGPGRRAVRTTAQPSEGVILLQVGSLEPSDVAQVVGDLALAWTAKGRHVVVLAIDRGGDLSGHLANAGVQVEVLGGWNPQAYEAAVRRLKVEVAFLHQNLDGIAILAAQNIPTVEVVHAYDHALHHDVAAYQATTATVKRRIAVSALVADIHASALMMSREAIEVIPPALNRQELIRPERRLLDYARRHWKQEFFFINVAPFLAIKSHAALVAAFAEVHKSAPQARLRLIGTIADPLVHQRVGEQIRAAHLDAVVHMPGPVDTRLLSRYLAASHVFVQPSVDEGHSFARMQAAHFGLPMILTAVADATTGVGDGERGIVIPSPPDIQKAASKAQMDEAGISIDAPAVPNLIAAMLEMMGNYESWQQRGYEGQARASGSVLQQQQDRYLAA